VEGLLEIAYFGLFILAVPPAFLENRCGFGGTVWVHAKRPIEKEETP
jgi:hypothetical protein